MINNSSIEKWSRLQAKNLNQQFVNEIITGLNCSPFEASAVLDSVHKVFGQFFQTSGTLSPGQILFQIVSINNGPQVNLKDCQQITVTLTLEAEGDLEIRKTSGVVGLRRHRVERMCNEAFEQGGLLTVEDLANRLLNCGERTICRDLVWFRNHNISLPLRSTIKDMGRTISHRVPIVKLWLNGKEYTEIRRQAHHSFYAIRNYIEKFKRVVALSNYGFDLNTISYLAKVSTDIVSIYLDIYKKADIIAFRQDELNEFIKKSFTGIEQGGSRD